MKDQIYKLVVDHTVELLPELEGKALAASDSLEDLGANSLDRNEILVMTLEALDFDEPLVSFHGAKRIGELVDLIHEKYSQNV